MDLGNLMHQIKDFDEKVRDAYEEIDETIFKGRDLKEIVTIDMYGDFIVDKIAISHEIASQIDEELLEALKEAFNNAILSIRSERNEVVRKELNKKVKGNFS